MGHARAGRLTPSIALRLGRVSNLPTVWTNVAAGVVLAGAAAPWPALLLLALAFSLSYVGGMFLNDAFDRDIDARERPERPIPAGQVAASAVFAVGYALLAAGWLLLVVVAARAGSGWQAALAGLLLAAAIVLYDAWHKGNALSPLLMGLCRVLVYAGAALAVATALPPPLLAAMLVVLCYLVGLTYAAKQETLRRIGNAWPLGFLAVPLLLAAWLATSGWIAATCALLFIGWTLRALRLLLRRGPVDVPRAVVALIAGICLLDAVLLAGAGAPLLATIAVACFLLTLALQRHVPGT